MAYREGKLKQNLQKMDGSLTYIFYSQNLSMHCSVRYSRRPGRKYPHLVRPFQLFRASQSKGSFKKKHFSNLFFVTNFGKNGHLLGLGSGMGFNARNLKGISHLAGTNSEQLFHL